MMSAIEERVSIMKMVPLKSLKRMSISLQEIIMETWLAFTIQMAACEQNLLLFIVKLSFLCLKKPLQN